MTPRHSVTRWLGALGVIFALVGLQGATSTQTSLAETQQKADQGDAAAQYNLGDMYRRGDGVPQDDAQAVVWYRQAADQGDADAQNNLGVMYRNGQGVPQDYSQAMAWYRQAADQGYAEAQYNLGLMYANGQGVPRDLTQALAWYRQAADQGDAYAQYNLGLMYAIANWQWLLGSSILLGVLGWSAARVLRRRRAGKPIGF